jgi:hypothetical protein
VEERVTAGQQTLVRGHVPSHYELELITRVMASWPLLQPVVNITCLVLEIDGDTKFGPDHAGGKRHDQLFKGIVRRPEDRSELAIQS